MLDASVVLAAARTDLARLPRVLRVLLEGLPLALWRERPAAAEWSPVEIVCHLRDEEAEDFAARRAANLEFLATVAPERLHRSVPAAPRAARRDAGAARRPPLGTAARRLRRADSLRVRGLRQ